MHKHKNVTYMTHEQVYILYKKTKFKIYLNDTWINAYSSIFDGILNYELWQRNYVTLLSYSQLAVPLQAPQPNISITRQHCQSRMVLHTTVYNPNFYSHIRKSLYRSKYNFFGYSFFNCNTIACKFRCCLLSLRSLHPNDFVLNIPHTCPNIYSFNNCPCILFFNVLM